MCLAHARLRLGISRPEGEPHGAFPLNNTARHRLSPAYFLTQSVSGAMAPPPVAGPGPRLALAGRDDIPPTPSVTAKMALVAAAELAAAGVRERGGGSSGRKGRGSPV